MGTGGWDNPRVNKKIENLAGKIVSTNSLKNSNLIAIRKVESQLPTGHFALWHQMEDMQLFGKVDLLRVN